MRTLNDIIPPSRRNRDIEPTSVYSEKSRFPYTTLLTILVVIGLSIGALFYFSSAKVNITPNTISVAVQSSFTGTESSGTLPYEIITTQKIATQSIKGNGSKTATSSASGNITVYNTQVKSLKLLVNTRFASTAGLIFKVPTPITIPGGTPAKPGSITVKAYADQPGSTYNIAATSFTLPGFAGTPQASQVYARSTSAMTGGASGTVPIVDSALESQTKTALMKALEPDLIASIKIPSGYFLPTGATATTFEELAPVASATTGQVDVRVQGTVTAVVFPSTLLAKAIATSVTGLGYQGEALSLTPASTIVLTAEKALPEPDATSFTFRLSGNASLLYVVDPTRIAAAVSGKTRSAAEVALTNYPEVKRAVIILRPFWRQNFPQDPASITIHVSE